MIDYIQLFKDRNLFNQCTNEIELNNLLNKKKIIFYIRVKVFILSAVMQVMTPSMSNEKW